MRWQKVLKHKSIILPMSCPSTVVVVVVSRAAVVEVVVVVLSNAAVVVVVPGPTVDVAWHCPSP